jgi:hypothetical protein
MFEGTIAGGDPPRALARPLEDGNVRFKQAHQQRTGMLENTDLYWRGLVFLKCHWPSCLHDSFSSQASPFSRNRARYYLKIALMKRLPKSHSLEYVFTKREPKKGHGYTLDFAPFCELRLPSLEQ